MSTKTVEMPNRRATVAFLCDRNRAGFPQDATNGMARRMLLETVIIPSLNRQDAGKWGLIAKPGNVVACDQMMWQDTREVVTVLHGQGPMWELYTGEVPKNWKWLEANEGKVPKTPAPLAHEFDGAQVLAFKEDIERIVDEDGTPLVKNVVWLVANMQHDAVTIGYAAAREKYLTSLHAEFAPEGHAVPAHRAMPEEGR